MYPNLNRLPSNHFNFVWQHVWLPQTKTKHDNLIFFFLTFYVMMILFILVIKSLDHYKIDVLSPMSSASSLDTRCMSFVIRS